MKNIFAIVVAVVVVVMFNNLKAEKRNGKHNQYLPYGFQPYAKANHDQKTKKMRQNSITPPTPSPPGPDPNKNPYSICWSICKAERDAYYKLLLIADCFLVCVCVCFVSEPCHHPSQNTGIWIQMDRSWTQTAAPTYNEERVAVRLCIQTKR